MSGFFSLGGKEQQDHHHQHHQQQQQDTTNSLFLFKNEEIYNKSFELWQQYCQLHQQRLQTHQVQDVDFSVGPSRRVITSGGGGGGGDEPSSYRSPASGGGGFRVMRSSQGGSSSGSMNCQDCGNQAKKDCPHLRCRTCCKSRGFHCETHVKSTWVPAAKRRERQQQLAALQQQPQQQQPQQQNQEHQQQQLQHLSLRGETPVKRPRDHHGASSSSNLACARLTTTSSGLEVGHFPAELNSPAVFRCVRVSAIDDAEDQFAYQTAVNIGGHVFKGILYDQGPESRFAGGGGEGSSGSQQQPLNLITAVSNTTTTATTTGIATNQAINMLDPSVYPTPLTAFMAGTQFFPPPRP